MDSHTEVNFSATYIALRVCSVTGPVFIFDNPFANAIKMINWSCKWGSTHVLQCKLSNNAFAASSPTWFDGFPEMKFWDYFHQHPSKHLPVQSEQ